MVKIIVVVAVLLASCSSLQSVAQASPAPVGAATQDDNSCCRRP